MSWFFLFKCNVMILLWFNFIRGLNIIFPCLFLGTVLFDDDLKQNMNRHNYYGQMKILFDFPNGFSHPTTCYFVVVNGTLQFCL